MISIPAAQETDMYKVILFVVVIAVGVGGFFWPRQKHDAVWWENERIRMELAQRLSLAKFRLNAMDASQGHAESVLDEQARITARLEDLNYQREKLTGIIDQQGVELTAFRKQVLQSLRDRAVGRRWTEFEAGNDGRFTDAKVAWVDDLGVTIRHRDGSARLRYEDLNDQQRRSLGLDQTTAAAAVIEEYEQAMAHEAWIQDEMEAAERSEQDLAKSVMSRSVAKLQPVRSQSVAPLDSSDSALNVPALRAAPRKLYTGVRTPRSRVRTTVFYYYNAPYRCYGTPRMTYGIRRPRLPQPPKSPSTP